MTTKDKIEVLNIIKSYPEIMQIFILYKTLTWEEFINKYNEEDRAFMGFANLTEFEHEKVRAWYNEK